ncbi:MAG: MBL fold metallo-hydrolase [Gemmatimonadetes bacterium]|nr:MBL fold metallo-hydrolase [Gemmatimonadota bacterium]MDA1102420.1 MBL fold metallo-hydrolase [Gemmatimonadota bacterium]
MIRLRIAMLFSVALATSLPLAAQAPYETTEIADGVYQFRWQNHNALFMVSDEGVVVFDPIEVEPAGRLAREIMRVAPGAPIAAIVYSHSDADHSTGASALLETMGQASAPIIAHENAVAPIRARANPDQPLPTVTLAERLTFRIGGREVQLHYLGPSHSDNMIVPFIPDVGVAFAVDFVANDRMGFQDLPGWYFPDFFDAVAGLLQIPFETIVFGHGPAGDRATIQRQIAYYDDLTSAVRDAVDRGWSEDQAAAQIRLAAYATWNQYEAWFPLNVRGVHRWLSR